jgi:SAM-dependent methyltransferase
MSDPVLPFTGERFTPECVREIAYEHWHRYAFALPLARGRRVLDAACGEGYGSALLAGVAGSVLGVDLDEATLAHARSRYAGGNLRFEQADVTALDALPDASFDLVTSFETLEHVHEQSRMLAGFARLLAPGGLLLVSTPDKRTYSEQAGTDNPHHVRELYREEFEALLQEHYPHRRIYGQKLAFVSMLLPADGDGRGQPVFSSLDGQRVHDRFDHPPMYYLAACARDAAALDGLPSLSLHGDREESVYADYYREIRANMAAARHIRHLEDEIARLREAGSKP